jgi:hypothetical protein
MIGGLPIGTLQKRLNAAFLVTAVLAAVSWHEKGRLPDFTAIRPELLQDPIQGETSRPPFAFRFRNRDYNVKPLATYELWGLVVSHNDINAFSDIYHDRNSVDIKDLGVIWNKNLRTNDFHRVKFWNGPWTVNWRFPFGTVFHSENISNNHIVTPDETFRDRVKRVRVGDQIHLQGLLVSYQAADQPGFWRRSSLRRDDSGDGACEVVYLDDLEVLQQGTPGWYGALYWATAGLILIPALKFLLVLLEAAG